MQVFKPQPEALYGIETTAHLTHLPRRTILVYCKHHLVSPIEDVPGGGYFFDSAAIRRLRRIEELRARFGVNINGLKFILRLLNEMERMHYDEFAE
jgi:DNA-binding transcriptional MerR regulator